MALPHHRIVPLDPLQHAGLRVSTAPHFPEFAKDQLIPIQLREFAAVACEWPVIFVKHQDKTRFIAVALMGLRQEENLYCQNGHWSAPYVPLSLRNPPFSLTADDHGHALRLCIDEGHPAVSVYQGQALFERDGTQSAYLRQRVETLAQYVRDSSETEHFVTLLQDLDLIRPKTLHITLPEENGIRVDGVYLIDEKAFNQLPIDALEVLRQQGLLPAIYAHLFSMQQIHRLSIKYQNFHQVRL